MESAGSKYPLNSEGAKSHQILFTDEVQPWMIFALLFAAGMLTLLVAPRFHRRSTQKSLSAAHGHKQERIAEMRRGPDICERSMRSEAQAVRARDALLLRGVRSEVASSDGEHVLVTELADKEEVEEVLASLG